MGAGRTNLAPNQGLLLDRLLGHTRPQFQRTGSLLRHVTSSSCCGVFLSCGMLASLQVWCVGLAARLHIGSQFPDQGWRWCSLHWKADSPPLGQQGSPLLSSLNPCYYSTKTCSVNSRLSERERKQWLPLGYLPSMVALIPPIYDFMSFCYFYLLLPLPENFSFLLFTQLKSQSYVTPC